MNATQQNGPKLVPLVCTKCGGRLETEEPKVLVAENSVVIKSGNKLTCQFCKTEFLPGDELKLFSGSLSINIKGSVSGSNIIVGNGNKVKTTIVRGSHSKQD